MTIDWHSLVLICGMAIFAEYEIRRKWVRDIKPGPMSFADRNWPRMVFTVILTPGLANYILGLVTKF